MATGIFCHCAVVHLIATTPRRRKVSMASTNLAGVSRPINGSWAGSGITLTGSVAQELPLGKLNLYRQDVRPCSLLSGLLIGVSLSGSPAQVAGSDFFICPEPNLRFQISLQIQ